MEGNGMEIQDDVMLKTWERHPRLTAEMVMDRLAHYESLGDYASVDDVLFGRMMGAEAIKETGDPAMMAEALDFIGRSMAARNYDLIFGRHHAVSFLKWEHHVVRYWLTSNLPSLRRFQSTVDAWGIRGKPLVWDHPHVRKFLGNPYFQSVLAKQGITLTTRAHSAVAQEPRQDR